MEFTRRDTVEIVERKSAFDGVGSLKCHPIDLSLDRQVIFSLERVQHVVQFTGRVVTYLHRPITTQYSVIQCFKLCISTKLREYGGCVSVNNSMIFTLSHQLEAYERNQTHFQCVDNWNVVVRIE